MEPRADVFSAGVAIVHPDEDGRCLYLLVRCFNYWDFPKGEVEKGESPLQGAKREVWEETSISGLAFDWGLEYSQTAAYGRQNKVARYYLARAQNMDVELQISPELGKPENDEYRWVDYAEANMLLVPRVQRVLRWARTLSGCPV